MPILSGDKEWTEQQRKCSKQNKSGEKIRTSLFLGNGCLSLSSRQKSTQGPASIEDIRHGRLVEIGLVQQHLTWIPSKVELGKQQVLQHRSSMQ